MAMKNFHDSVRKWKDIRDNPEEKGYKISHTCGFCDEFDCQTDCPILNTVCKTKKDTEPAPIKQAENAYSFGDFSTVSIVADKILKEIKKHKDEF